MDLNSNVIFQNHGNVTRVQVHKGYCFVQFEKGIEAKAAIDKENGSMLLGKRINVSISRKKNNNFFFMMNNNNNFSREIGKRIDVKTAVRNTNKPDQPNDNVSSNDNMNDMDHSEF